MFVFTIISKSHCGVITVALKACLTGCVQQFHRFISYSFIENESEKGFTVWKFKKFLHKINAAKTQHKHPLVHCYIYISNKAKCGGCLQNYNQCLLFVFNSHCCSLRKLMAEQKFHSYLGVSRCSWEVSGYRSVKITAETGHISNLMTSVHKLWLSSSAFQMMQTTLSTVNHSTHFI